MKRELDINMFRKKLKNIHEESLAPDFLTTDGEVYIYENILKPAVADMPVRVREVNFDAFNFEDIASLIDDKCEELATEFCGVENIIGAFREARAQIAVSRMFF